MQVYKLSIDDSGCVHINDSDGNVFHDEDRKIDIIWRQLEITRIGKMLMQDEDFASDKYLIENIKSILSNYFVEKEAFEKDNHYRLLRLAILDTKEDLGI